jgi:hypothetical protein
MKMKEVLHMNEFINRLNEFMNDVSKYGILVLFLAILLIHLFSKYNILALNIVTYSLGIIGTLLCGYYIGKTVGESKNKN